MDNILRTVDFGVVKIEHDKARVLTLAQDAALLLSNSVLAESSLPGPASPPRLASPPGLTASRRRDPPCSAVLRLARRRPWMFGL